MVSCFECHTIYMEAVQSGDGVESMLQRLWAVHQDCTVIRVLQTTDLAGLEAPNVEKVSIETVF